MFLRISWQPYDQSIQNNLQCSKNKTANVVNQIVKAANKCFRLYQANVPQIDAK